MVDSLAAGSTEFLFCAQVKWLKHYLGDDFPEKGILLINVYWLRPMEFIVSFIVVSPMMTRGLIHGIVTSKSLVALAFVLIPAVVWLLFSAIHYVCRHTPHRMEYLFRTHA